MYRDNPRRRKGSACEGPDEINLSLSLYIYIYIHIGIYMYMYIHVSGYNPSRRGVRLRRADEGGRARVVQLLLHV